MATVYRAFDPISNREVAVKVLPPEMLHKLLTRARFKRELKMIASLEHPAIVPVYDVGEEESQPFFVMRYMSGGSLAELIEKGNFSLRDAALIIERLASALDHAHSRGIIHRDIKPDNVLFDASDNPYLSDFGVAKLMETAVSATDASANDAIGTAAYLSPEQARGQNVDQRADIYGLGAILYEMLTGEPPYHGDTVIGVALQHVNDPIPDVLTIRPDLPAEVDTIIRTAMAKNREDRYQNAVDLARALNKVAFGEERTIPSSATMQDRQDPLGTVRRTAGFLFFAAILLIGVAGVLAWQGQLPFPFAGNSTPTTIATSVPPTAAPTLTLTPEPTPTVTTTASDGTPVVATVPGGADQVAFVSGNDLYLMNTDGSDLIQIRTENSAKSNLHWLADGRLIYMSRNCAYSMDSETRQTQEIICFNSDELLEGFRVSSDGKFVAISIQRTLNILSFDPALLKDFDTRFNLLALADNCFYNQYAFRDVLWSKSGTQLAAHVVDTQLVSSDQIFLLTVDIPRCATVGPVRLDRIPGARIDFEGEKRIGNYDWDGDHLFLLNDSLRNDGFGNLYLYDSQTRVGEKINPIDGDCCYRDARWSPDGSYILFVFQPLGGNDLDFYYIPFAELGDGSAWQPIPIPDSVFSTPREKPQPALRPIQ